MIIPQTTTIFRLQQVLGNQSLRFIPKIQREKCNCGAHEDEHHYGEYGCNNIYGEPMCDHCECAASPVLYDDEIVSDCCGQVLVDPSNMEPLA